MLHSDAAARSNLSPLSSSSGPSQRHRAGRRPELRLRQQQRRPASGLRGRDICQTGRRESARREQQQVQHVFRFPFVPGLNTDNLTTSSTRPEEDVIIVITIIIITSLMLNLKASLL